MATEALHGGMGAREGETRPAVVEYSAYPLACAVASLAIGRKARCGMIGIGGLVVLCQVAADTASIQTGIPSIRVAGRTVHVDVSPAQRESRRCVVKLGASPARSGMAKCTILREASRCMVRIRCVVIPI